MLFSPPAVRTFARASALSLLASAACAQTFTLVGAGCPGAAGVPALHANGLPAQGQTMQITLTRVPVGSVAALWLGLSQLPTPIDLGFAGAPGCGLLTLPDIISLNAAAANGSAAIDITIPPTFPVGFAFWTQWIDLYTPLAQITVSNAGKAVTGPVGPVMTFGSITAPPSGPVGTVFIIRVTGLGLTCCNNPDNLCLQISDAIGLRSLLRATNVAFDTNTNEDVVTAVLATANAGPVAGGRLGMMRGAGMQPPVNPSACLTVPVSAWAWQGFDLPGAAIGPATAFTPLPSPNRVTLSFTYDSGSNSMYCDVPGYPWAGSGLFPPGATATTDAHGDLNCGGPTPGGHFDHFIESVAVKASCAAGITAQALVNEHAPQVQAALDNAFGPGRLTVTAEPGARLRIKPTNPSCTLTGGGGSVVLGM